MGEVPPARETWIASVLKPAGNVTTLTGRWNPFSQQPSDFGFGDDGRYAGSGGTVGAL